MPRQRMTDALLGAAIKTVEELEALVVMLDNINADEGPTRLVSKLREAANLFDRLPLLASDLSMIKRRLRRLLSTDPDVTPKGVSVRDLESVVPEPRLERDDQGRVKTRPGMPLPKKP